MAGRLGFQLRRYRQRTGLTQEELAERSGVSVRTIRRLETGEQRSARVSSIRQLSEVLGLNPEEHEDFVSAAAGTVGTGPKPSEAGRYSPVPRQLPVPPHGFVSRTAELARLDGAAKHNSTVVVSTIGGSGGIGKTWLVSHWAHQRKHTFPDGQLFIDLRGYTPGGVQPMEPNAALRVLLSGLVADSGLIPRDLDDRAALFRTLTAERRMLIVLDNARDSAQVAPLLPGGSSCFVLVTSRDRLAGLITGHGAQAVPLDVMDAADARTLLGRHLGSDRLETAPEAVDTVLDCCGGLPLALGVVAGRAALDPDLPLASVAAELGDEATRLGGLDADDPAASVRTALTSSYAVLERREAGTHALLSVAPGPDISQEAVTALIGTADDEADEVLRNLQNLSLIAQPVAGRYRMHDLVRLHATEQAQSMVPERRRQLAMRRLVDFYTHTAINAADAMLEKDPLVIDLPSLLPGCRPQLLTGSTEALAWYDTEYFCLLAVFDYAVARGWNLQVLGLAWATYHYLMRRGLMHDAIGMWRSALAAAKRLDDPRALSQAYRRLGVSCARAGLDTEGLVHIREALAIAERAGDVEGQASAQGKLCLVLSERGDWQPALDHATESLRLYKLLDDTFWQANLLNGVGWCSAHVGRYDEARAACEEALALIRSFNDQRGEAFTLDSLGYIAHHDANYAQALDYYREALRLMREIGEDNVQVVTLDQMAQTHVALGEPNKARIAWQRALDLLQSQHRPAEAERIRGQLATLD